MQKKKIIAIILLSLAAIFTLAGAVNSGENFERTLKEAKEEGCFLGCGYALENISDRMHRAEEVKHCQIICQVEI